jgi:hypothetical protein
MGKLFLIILYVLRLRGRSNWYAFFGQQKIQHWWKRIWKKHQSLCKWCNNGLKGWAIKKEDVTINCYSVNNNYKTALNIGLDIAYAGPFKALVEADQQCLKQIFFKHSSQFLPYGVFTLMSLCYCVCRFVQNRNNSFFHNMPTDLVWKKGRKQILIFIAISTLTLEYLFFSSFLFV